jgi:hypothetical protein
LQRIAPAPALEIGYASAQRASASKGRKVMREFGCRIAILGTLALSAMCAGGRSAAAPISPDALRLQRLTQPAQFMYLGRPYCWYPYGWAGAGWYWCGYGTRTGIGWGGVYGWNGWEVPRYRAMRVPPGYRFRRY